MRALVTGGSGYVGHAVVRALARRSWRVRVLDPGRRHPRWPAGVDHRRASLLDPTALTAAGAGVDVIFHVAGVWGDAETMHALHVEGTRRLLALGRPLVLTSSSVTCGFGPMSCPGREDDPSEDPRSPIRGTGEAYRATKLKAEEMVRAQGGWLVHPDFVVGPGDVRGVVMRPLVRAAQLPVIPAPRGGKCFVGVEDVGEGHVLAFERGRRGRRYLLGAENRTYRDVIVRLAGFLGHRPRVLRVPRSLGPLIGGAWEQMQLDRYRDGSRARVELGWRPGPVDAALLAAALE